jgi:hypothetical protein
MDCLSGANIDTENLEQNASPNPVWHLPFAVSSDCVCPFAAYAGHLLSVLTPSHVPSVLPTDHSVLAAMQQNKSGHATTANGRFGQCRDAIVYTVTVPWINSHRRSVAANDELLMSTEWNTMI